MATVTKVGLMNVREIISSLHNHRENIKDSRETLTAQVVSETIFIKYAVSSLLNAISIFFRR